MKNIIKTFEQFTSDYNEINEGENAFVKNKPIALETEEEDVKPQNIDYIQATYIRDKEDEDEKMREENTDSDTKQNI